MNSIFKQYGISTRNDEAANDLAINNNLDSTELLKALYENPEKLKLSKFAVNKIIQKGDGQGISKASNFDSSHINLLSNDQLKRELHNILTKPNIIDKDQHDRIIENVPEDDFHRVITLLPEGKARKLVDDIIGINGQNKYNQKKAHNILKELPLSEEIIKHVKEHGSPSDKFAMFYNESLPQNHAKEMHDNWVGNKNGYDSHDLKMMIKHKHPFEKDADNYFISSHEIASKEYPIDQFIKDNYMNDDIVGMPKHEWMSANFDPNNENADYEAMYNHHLNDKAKSMADMPHVYSDYMDTLSDRNIDLAHKAYQKDMENTHLNPKYLPKKLFETNEKQGSELTKSLNQSSKVKIAQLLSFLHEKQNDLQALQQQNPQAGESIIKLMKIALDMYNKLTQSTPEAVLQEEEVKQGLDEQNNTQQAPNEQNNTQQAQQTENVAPPPQGQALTHPLPTYETGAVREYSPQNARMKTQDGRWVSVASGKAVDPLSGTRSDGQ